MNGFRSLVLQDLPHVLPSKGLQLSSSHLHTTTTARRFWSFFEFSAKDACRDSKKCPKEIVSSSLMSSNEFEDVSRARTSLPDAGAINSTMTLNPKLHAYQFDLKTTPMSCLRIPRPLKQDHLISLLDGNPVPRTLKWKLKGYKTLRHEQAGDFAFVPGAATYDFDVLSREDYGKPMTAIEPSKAEENLPQEGTVKALENGIESDKDALSDVAKSHEGQEEGQGKVTCQAVNVTESSKGEEIGCIETKNEGSNDQNVDAGAKSVTIPGHGAAPMTQKGVEYLPISKSELSAGQRKCQGQPSAQYSSEPPTKMSKPSSSELRPEESVEANAKHPESSVEPYEQREPETIESAPKTSASSSPEAAQDVTSEWSTMEPESDSMVAKEGNAWREEASKDPVEDSVKQASEPMETAPEDQAQKSLANPEITPKIEQQQSGVQSPPYFAPRSWRESKNPAKENGSSEGTTYESIVGIPARGTSTLKIPSPSNGMREKTSPCAATRARMQQNGARMQQKGASNGPAKQIGSFGIDGSSMTGGSSGSGGGSRKPPSSFPPFTAQRMSSSNSSYLLRKLPPRAGKTAPRQAESSRNSVQSISTSSGNQMSRKCRDSDRDDGCSRPRDKCSRRRSCEREERRPKCQRESKQKKPCKRYCCPSLQSSTDCDYDKFQCPKKQKGCGGGGSSNRRHESKKSKDPTCLPNEEEANSFGNSCRNDRGSDRSMCTDPSRSRSDRSCKRDRGCNRERRDRSCNREEQGCRNRNRSCQRQERDCGQQQGEGRVICTKPRKRDSCNRDRDCGKRSANCTGRRNFTHSAFVKPSTSLRKAKRFASLPALGLSLIGMKVEKNDLKQTLDTCSKSRFYGKCSRPQTSGEKDKSCKKGPPKCLNKEASDKRTESKCKTSCDSMKQKDTGKTESKSDNYCMQRRQQLCKDKKKDVAASKGGEESAKERADREFKEMQECTKNIRKKGGKDKKKDGAGEKKAAPTGLERVISPCKLKQAKKESGKDKDPSKACCTPLIGAPLNCPVSSAFTSQESTPMNNQSESILRSSQFDDYDTRDFSSSHPRKFWTFGDDDEFSTEIEVMPAPIPIEIEEESSFCGNSWFLSWFNQNGS